MANPILVDCPEGEWTKVATALQSGSIHISSTAPDLYGYTYRDTGGVAPTLFTEAIPMTPTLNFGGAELSGIDVYVWPVGAAGKVRADIYPVVSSYSVSLV